MILSISQYIEALWSPEGRFATLERLYPLKDEAGMPLFTMPGHGLVDFTVMAGEERCTLRCPLRFDAGAATRLRSLAEKDKGLGGRFFTEWKVLPAEIVLFGADGHDLEVDCMMRPVPEGEPFVDFLERDAARGDTVAVGRLAENFEELVAWVIKAGGSRGIALGRLIVAPDGGVRINAFSATDETERIRGMLRAEGGYLFEPQDGLETSEYDYDFDGQGDVRCVRDGGGWMYVDRMGRTVIDAVWTKAEPFRAGRAEVETTQGNGLIDIRGREVLPAVYEEVVWDDYWGLVSVIAEGRWSLANREGRILTTFPYDWLGECSEGLLLAVREGRCGFLDTSGRESVPFAYDDASSFSEGYALVSRGGEEFFIDARGERI